MTLRQTALGLCVLSSLLSACWNEKKGSQVVSFDCDPLFKEVIDLVEKNYIDQPNLETMRIGALSGMLSSLDPYSAYLTPKAYDLLTDSTDGVFGGIGVEMCPADGGVRIISVLDDSPAFVAGVQSGDIIAAVDQRPTYNMTYSEIVGALHGTPKTRLKLLIQRQDRELSLELIRQKITVNPVKLIIKDGVGYIRIAYFSDQVADRLKEIIETFDKREESLRGIILDLRNNPGGILDQAIRTVGFFIKSGAVVKFQERGSPEKTLTTYEKVSLPTVPVVVLINSGSASASEIVASALKFHHRALILGKRSHGKGSIQSVFPIPGVGGVKITTAKFSTLDGISLSGRGVSPDVTVDADPNINNISLGNKNSLSEDDVQLMRAFELVTSLVSLKKWS
ncbi:MAG: S41 family peptidase [Candidatus Paracaedibacteraceae bacterium]|nr:S41 family peptidase [Candidatus Paracaedibacteraceae bacterium]